MEGTVCSIRYKVGNRLKYIIDGRRKIGIQYLHLSPSPTNPREDSGGKGIRGKWRNKRKIILKKGGGGVEKDTSNNIYLWFLPHAPSPQPFTRAEN